MTDSKLDRLVAEITDRFNRGRKTDIAEESERRRADRWSHLVAAALLLNELRARVDAEGCDYSAKLDRLMKMAEEFDREAELDRIQDECIHAARNARGAGLGASHHYRK